MKETIAVTVLVEIEYERHAGATRADIVTDALQVFTRDGIDDGWRHRVGRSRAIQARPTKQRISPRKAER